MIFFEIPGMNARDYITLNDGWRFHLGDVRDGANMFDDSGWQQVRIPHDWAIYGPFDRNIDLQDVRITQNMETVSSLKTGRSGGLPYIGVGWYRRELLLENFDKKTQCATLLFDGAMSEAQVFVNGQKVIFWPYGYNSFYVDITDYINSSSDKNQLAIRLENQPESARWYPGAGLFRNVHLVLTEKEHVPIWGTFVTTPFVSKTYASVKLLTTLKNVQPGEKIHIATQILDYNHNVVASKDNIQKLSVDNKIEQNLIVTSPDLWSPETPVLYTAVSKIYLGTRLVDTYSTRFGIRELKFVPDKGFFLNGVNRKFKGVCLHHDLGPLGAVVNTSALKHRLSMLKDMGCNAIRTTHNMPAPELISLCDEMGFMVIVESFDEWILPKVKNGYHRFFEEWAEKDMLNMLYCYRNSPSVVMWSIGNELAEQHELEGYKVAAFLRDICHREDPTRPVVCALEDIESSLANGFAAVPDIPGYNYRTHLYQKGYESLPHNLILGSETASTVSSRGIYKFPVKLLANATYDDHQSSSYDWEYCHWSNIPDIDFALSDDNEWCIGQFVWTGFDYLGEPTPYDTDAWPNHSSMFGIIDLASIPKDRYYLYKSVWNDKEKTLHVLPHWNWPERINMEVPVFVYTNYPAVELFVNGKSYGKKVKSKDDIYHRYRLIWDHVIYEPGELKAVAYNEYNIAVEEKIVKTAGEPYKLVLTPSTYQLTTDSEELVYINVKVVDKEGNFCPLDNRLVHFQVEGAGLFRAAANGDPTCLDLFHVPQMHLFNGQLTALVQSGGEKGEIIFKASAEGLHQAQLKFNVN